MGPDGCDYYHIDSDNGITIIEKLNGINYSIKSAKECDNLKEAKRENVSFNKQQKVYYNRLNELYDHLTEKYK